MWVELAPGPLKRAAIIVSLRKPLPQRPEEKLLACDNGSGLDAPVTGSLNSVRAVSAGQIVEQGVLRVIALNSPSKPGTISTVVFAINTVAGDVALMSKSGKGMIRLDHAQGIFVYPPSYQLVRVMESTIYEVQRADSGMHLPCTLSYYGDDTNSAPRVIRSSLDCQTIIQQVDSNAIFSSDIPKIL
jgi:hypothetical protein